jgi:methylmalonyl-CoA/ethylmalonyl-CoA epimerase
MSVNISVTTAPDFAARPYRRPRAPRQTMMQTLWRRVTAPKWRATVGFLHIDHVGIVAFTIEQAQDILGDALGLELDQPRSQWPTGAYFPPEQTYNYFFQVGGGETQVEVLVPDAGATSGTARFLQTRGPGLHHICFACDNVHQEAERLLANGLQEIDLPRRADGQRNVAFFHPRSTGGVLTELIPARPMPADASRLHRPT